MEKKDVIWLSWDRHRRTVELSQSIGAPLRVIRCSPLGGPIRGGFSPSGGLSLRRSGICGFIITESSSFRTPPCC